METTLPSKGGNRRRQCEAFDERGGSVELAHLFFHPPQTVIDDLALTEVLHDLVKLGRLRLDLAEMTLERALEKQAEAADERVVEIGVDERLFLTGRGKARQ